MCGIDGITDYYDINLKEKRNSILLENKNYIFKYEKLENFKQIVKIFDHFQPDVVIHLAAQAGVRYSIEEPLSYLNSNLVGTFNVLEAIKSLKCMHFLMASTSSVYGGNVEMPYKETDKTEMPMSFYSATKKSAEAMSHAYSHLFDIPTTCFRFFTVYGPWGRPDMALFKFTKNILNGKPIEVYNNGLMKRDFTYIDDLVISIVKLVDQVPNVKNDINKMKNDSLSSIAPWRVVNIGSSSPIKLEYFLEVLEKKIGTKIKKRYLEMQAGDVKETYADISLLQSLINYTPSTDIEIGIENFLTWYKKYYQDRILNE